MHIQMPILKPFKMTYVKVVCLFLCLSICHNAAICYIFSICLELSV